ncbi:MBL fold metallo-hydrolase [Aeromicrobium wangtongii]|uniref:MBL fold metallo-hydrolase n=1 Tax=Aeromicrobium wangtongii TaxID=2969247 RepID=A0ABY5MBL7_9ACTN|nr:MBL fold metallo-hydrolase [Aeromicrobium wangtongii]MCD9199734.1 MBL fold metallo-hydrolase [Aeromicrobium wangtongii]UUP14083.1 MBL fold metallo-hydrolase [Aeromicrobium wangtongii]
MITMDAAPGVHCVTSAGTNLYVVPDDGAVTLVDAGLPRMWAETTQLLRSLGHTWHDVAGIVLTHGHFDHIGILARAAAEHGVPAWVHPGDRRIVQHPYRYHPGRPRLLYPLRYPRSVPHLTSMVAAGALRVRGAEAVYSFADGDALDLPGAPTVIATPGHTDGHCAIRMPSRDVIFTGDALVTLDPYTGRTGPRIVAQAGTQDAAVAKVSLRQIGAVEARFVAPGHGQVWRRGAAEAAAVAEAAPLP